MNELAEPFPISVQAVSKHLKVLERAGLISRGRAARLRPSRIRGDALREATEWLAGTAASGAIASTGWTSGSDRVTMADAPKPGTGS